jgi:hypothetical protein
METEIHLFRSYHQLITLEFLDLFEHRMTHRNRSLPKIHGGVRRHNFPYGGYLPTDHRAKLELITSHSESQAEQENNVHLPVHSRKAGFLRGHFIPQGRDLSVNVLSQQILMPVHDLTAMGKFSGSMLNFKESMRCTMLFLSRNWLSFR